METDSVSVDLTRADNEEVCAVSKLCMLNNGRIAVVELGNTEMKTADIVKIDCFKPPSVQQAVKRFREAGRIEDRPRKRQTPIPTTPKKIQKNRC
ncbi:hypothetical protein KIN20_013234 [Parelaphostrongylus tenuis]|uniref:Uncharacterized protein n=1 Tax=Parelaphostrongylus tenuis TaxID=148309 RepID=A0AAD5MBV0_PARTN|nr:hypothetical protein KIN20_013234 [Parelaphostrongylus tenuis]